AYTINLGVCSITCAELRGAIARLKLAWEAGFRRIFLHMDSTAAISLFGESETAIHQHALEVIQFRELMARDWKLPVLVVTCTEPQTLGDFFGQTKSVG
ncbi:hypothetical protein LINPERHAP1_LOCUS28051, partial [Linum perenne]